MKQQKLIPGRVKSLEELNATHGTFWDSTEALRGSTGHQLALQVSN